MTAQDIRRLRALAWMLSYQNIKENITYASRVCAQLYQCKYDSLNQSLSV
jgi:hypothetical protein